jgi:hypothetical protein
MTTRPQIDIASLSGVAALRLERKGRGRALRIARDR